MSEELNELAATSRNWAGDGPTGAMLSAMRAFVSVATKDESRLRAAAALLNTQPPGSAAWIAVACGTLVERGAAADVSGTAVLELLQSWLINLPLPADDDAEPPEPTPAQKRLLPPFQYVCQSAVSHLARLPALRESLGQKDALLDRLDWLRGYSAGAWWVHEALLKTSGTLVLLHPPSGAGLRLTYTNVANCFHLFSLLQTAVGTRLEGGHAPNEAVAWVARGKSSEQMSDAAWWHYGDPRSPKADIAASIWGEGRVRDIPRVNGEPVILLWPLLLQSRQWDAGFLGPHLEAMPADAVAERMLTADESAAWLNTLGVERPRKSWWRR